MRLTATPPLAHHALRRVWVAGGAFVILICLAPAAAKAADDEVDEADDAARPLASGYRIGLNGAPRVARVDLPVGLPSTVPVGGQSLQTDSVRLSDISYRFWISRGRADLGFGVGALALTAQPLGSVPTAAPSAAPNGALESQPIVLASAPSLTVGMRFRASPQSTFFADASGARGLGPNNGDAYLGKVGVEWKPAPFASRWNIAYGGIGWRLSSDSRMTLRIRRGGLGLYMRSQF